MTIGTVSRRLMANGEDDSDQKEEEDHRGATNNRETHAEDHQAKQRYLVHSAHITQKIIQIRTRIYTKKRE